MKDWTGCKSEVKGKRLLSVGCDHQRAFAQRSTLQYIEAINDSLTLSQLQDLCDLRHTKQESWFHFTAACERQKSSAWVGCDESSLSVPVSVAELQHLMMLTMSHYRSYLSMTGHLMMLTIGALVNKGVRPAHNDLICIGWGSMASILVCSCCRCSHQFVIKTPPSEVTPNIPTRSTYPCISHVFVGKGGNLENTAVCGLLSSAVAPIPRWMVSTNSGTSNSIWNMAIHRHSL